MFSDVKTEQREQARRLRRNEGASINEIATRVGVSKSSVSYWVRDIELTDEQTAELLRRNPAYNRQISGSGVQAARRREERIAYQLEGRRLARHGNPMHAAGCMLYWAEGEKSRNSLRFTNSDPEMVRFFVAFLRSCFNASDEIIRLRCNLFADHESRRREIECFWLEVTGLPRSCLCRSTVNVYSKYSKKKRSNRLPYGTVRIAVSRTKIVQGIYGAIQEYASFDRAEWLDGRS